MQILQHKSEDEPNGEVIPASPMPKSSLCKQEREGSKKGKNGAGSGNGEWGMGLGKQVPCPLSPLPIPHSLLLLLAIFASSAQWRLEAPVRIIRQMKDSDCI